MAQGTLEGELSFAQVPQLLRQAEALVAGGSLDLSRVSRADSAGLALLLELSRRSRSRPLAIRGANEQVLQLSRFFGLDKILHFE
ncbi:MAG TPA: STAS domain-containing protein [Nevskia sp.]|jgi:phospholipid transport system transporter-binding protein|nr:STAS domain-containing protein [Nevskia sp.]